MSQDNVENYRRAAAAWSSGDLDAALAFTDEDAEIISSVFIMEGSYRGHEGVRRWWRDLHGDLSLRWTKCQRAGHRDERDPIQSHSIHLVRRSTLSRNAASSARN